MNDTPASTTPRPFSAHTYAAAAMIGLAKPRYTGARWSAGGPEDSITFDDASSLPIDRLLEMLDPHLRLLATFPRGVAYGVLGALGFDPVLGQGLVEGESLAKFLDPPQGPDEIDNFPAELALIDRARVAAYRELVDSVCARWRTADAALVAQVAREATIPAADEYADRVVWTILASLATVVEALEAGQEVLVSRVL